MKKILSLSALFLILFFTQSCSQSKDDLKWSENLEQAIKTAKAENKTVLVNFTGSDWCQWCKKLSAEVFTQKEFKEFANKNLELVKIDFPRSIQQAPEVINYNKQLAEKYGIQGFPTILLVDKNGNVLTYTGYRDGGAASYVEHLKSFIM
ncbi:MAG: thioredoxin family protein [Ignavibacteriaceae bacterium]|nr:thioredoxin family protein [Ignavibacteriaceae bacterium]